MTNRRSGTDRSRLWGLFVACGGDGDPEGAPFLFLHGWPESWHSWRQIMALASRQVRAIAIDLPGIGESNCDPTDGSKRELVTAVHGLVEAMGLKEPHLWWARTSAAWSRTPTFECSRT